MNKLIFLAILAISLTSFSQDLKKFTVEQLSEMTVMIANQEKGTITGHGSGVIITDRNRYFLLTAAHVAKEMKMNSVIIFYRTNQIPIVRGLSQLTISKKPFLYHPEADLAIIELIPKSIEDNTLLSKSFPSNQIHGTKEPIERNREVLEIGYPAINTDLNYFSSIIRRGFLVTNFMRSKRYDANIVQTFQYLQNPSIEGMSGGPIFGEVEHLGMISNNSPTFLAGIYHGTFGDKTGGKLGVLTPLFYITDFDVDKWEIFKAK